MYWSANINILVHFTNFIIFLKCKLIFLFITSFIFNVSHMCLSPLDLASLAICPQLRKWDRSTSNSSWSNGSIPDTHNANSLFLLILPNPVILFMTSYFLNTKVVLVNSENSDSIKKNPREVKISNLPPNEK